MSDDYIPQRAEASQVRHPWRATARTIVAYTVAALAALAVGVPIVSDGMRGVLPPAALEFMGWLALFTGAMTATLTRLMALPEVDRLLRMIGLNADPSDAGHNDPR